MHVSGIIHCHSTYSYDAKLTLRELRELCIKNNVQFICMTEHTDELNPERAKEFVKECAEFSDETFLFIPGFEVPYKHAHVLMIGMRNFYSNYAPNIETLRPWSTEADFVVLAHPVRNHFDVDDGLLAEIDGIEVWNQQYEGKRVPRTRSLRLLEELRTHKPKLLATGGVDFHRKEHFGSPLITMELESLTEVLILQKLKSGGFKVESPQASFAGTHEDVPALIAKTYSESTAAAFIIVLGKTVNKLLASLGLSLPKFLKQLIRRQI